MNEFEKASEAVERDRDFALDCENVIEFLRNSKVATVSFSQGKFMRKIKKLAEKFPDKVEITYESDRVVVAHVPTSAIRISVIEPREMSEEQKQAARERLAKYRYERKNSARNPNESDETTEEEAVEEIIEEILEESGFEEEEKTE